MLAGNWRNYGSAGIPTSVCSALDNYLEWTDLVRKVSGIHNASELPSVPFCKLFHCLGFGWSRYSVWVGDDDLQTSIGSISAVKRCIYILFNYHIK